MRLSEKKKENIKKMNEAFAYAVRDDESMELAPDIQMVVDLHTATLINMIESEDDDIDILGVVDTALSDLFGDEEDAEDADEGFVEFDADDEEDFNDFCKWLFEE